GQPRGAQRLLIVSTRVEYLETFIDEVTRAMRARAQKVRTDRDSEPRERRMLRFVGECSSVKQLQAGRDVTWLISCVAEYGICADDRQCAEGENHDDVRYPADAPPRNAR